jgi:flagellar basal body P-ring protein FlgI
MFQRTLLLASVALGATGCLKEHTPRLQMEDDNERKLVRTIGDIADIQTNGAIPVSGIGLVVGLDGTGGGTPPGTYRQLAEEYLKKNKVDNPKEWLDSPNNAVVLVSAEIPAGAKRNDRVHVEVSLPPGSKAKSLRGGYLLESPLSHYATQSQVRGYLEEKTGVEPVGRGDALLKGHVLADAEGPLNIALQENTAAEADAAGKVDLGVKKAFVWKGAKAKREQPFYLVLNPDQQKFRMAIGVADRINETFHGPGAAEKLATARSEYTVVLNVPAQYRGNTAHFLRVVRMIPVDAVDMGGRYWKKLEEQLVQPETCLSAGLRLEALGRDTVKVLTNAIKSSPYPLVRFAAAESLAYLGEPIAAQELAKLAEAHPTLQAYCLAALSCLDEAASSIALQELLASPTPEVRYGAFRALRELDPRGEATRGVLLNKSYWLHHLALKATPMVHLLRGNRAEIVVFGADARLTGPFSLRVGPDLILSAKAGDAKCVISRFAVRKADRVEQCSLAVVDIIQTMAELGAQYDDVASMLTQARDTKCLTCDLAIDATPRQVDIQALAANAVVDKHMENEAELLRTPGETRESSVFDRR